MATFAEKTAEEQAAIQEYDKFLRGVTSSLMALMQKSNATVMEQWAASNVDPALATLDDAEVIPRTTGLAGTVDMTAAELKGLQAIIRGLTATAGANLGLVVKAVGINNGQQEP